MSESRFDEFMDALFHCDTVKVILNGIGESAFGTEDIYTSIKHIIEQRDELLKNEKIRQEITRSLKEERNELLKKERLLLDKVQQLESRNAELEDLIRWRDASKELPPRKEGYSWSEPVQALMPRILGNIEIRTLSFDYSLVVPNGGVWFHAIGNNWTPVHVNPIAWRPLDLPEITTGEDDNHDRA